MPLNKIVQDGRFCAKNVSVRNTYFHLGIPSHLEQVVSPYKLYIRRSDIVHRWLSFLNFSKIFYNKKVFFVPPEGCQIVKILNFDPHLAPPTFGGGTWSPHFCD